MPAHRQRKFTAGRHDHFGGHVVFFAALRRRPQPGDHGRPVRVRIGQIRGQVVLISHFPGPDSRRMNIARDHFGHVLPHERDGLALRVTPGAARFAHHVGHAGVEPEQAGYQAEPRLLGGAHHVVQLRKIRVLILVVELPVDGPESACREARERYPLFGQQLEPFAALDGLGLAQTAQKCVEKIDSDAAIRRAALQQHSALSDGQSRKRFLGPYGRGPQHQACNQNQRSAHYSILRISDRTGTEYVPAVVTTTRRRPRLRRSPRIRFSDLWHQTAKCYSIDFHVRCLALSGEPFELPYTPGQVSGSGFQGNRQSR